LIILNGKIVKPKLDIIFKRIFTDKDNEDMLRQLIADIINIQASDISDLVIENCEISPQSIGGKFVSLDLVLKVDDKYINIELQLKDYGNFIERTLYYWAKRFSKQLKKGEDYSRLARTISINIVDYKLFSDNKDKFNYYSKYQLVDTEHNNRLLTDLCTLYYLEIPKVRKLQCCENHIWEWLKFLSLESEEELEMLSKTAALPEVQKGISIIRRFSSDEQIQIEAERREKAIRDEISALSFAKNKGIEIGEKKGRQKRDKELILKWKAAGMSDDDIANLLK